MAEPLKLHRCGATFLHIGGEPCWKVERELRERNIPYEVVKHGFGRSDKARADVIELSGQPKLPVIEFPDGEVYRDESQAMAERIRSGELDPS